MNKKTGNFTDKNSPLAERVYQGIYRQIALGRWQVGDKLPGFKAIAETYGVSRFPVQVALDKLEKEGYLEKIEKKGVFLKNRLPYDAVSGSTIGIITEDYRYWEHTPTTVSAGTFGLWELSALTAFLADKGFKAVEINISNGNENDEESITDAVGYISLISKERLKGSGKINENAPCVFLGVEDFESIPSVNGDIEYNAYLLTEYLINSGHKSIIPFTMNCVDENCIAAALDGYKTAAKKHDIKTNVEDEFLRVFRGGHVDLSEIFPALLKYHVDSVAYLALSVEDARQLIEYAGNAGIKVPDQLSVASLQMGWLSPPHFSTITGGMYDWDEIMETCLELLINPGAMHGKTLGRLYYRPEVSEGESVFSHQ